MSLMPPPPLRKPAPMRWTKEEFYRLVDLGGFRGRRVFVHRGELIEMPPMGWRHATALMKITRVLQLQFPEHIVRIQMPLEVPGDFTPEPDAALFSSPAAFAFPRPTQSLLVIEVSDSSLELDREKAGVYAAANVPEYWLLNVVDRQLEVYRNGTPDSASETGFRYADVRALGEGDSIATLIDSSVVIKVGEMLP